MGRISIIAKRLKQARKRAGISSQRKLGVLAGMDVSGAGTRMNFYEKGTNEPNLLTLMRIGAVVGAPVAYFYCEDDALADLVLKFSMLDEVQKKRLLAFVDKL